MKKKIFLSFKPDFFRPILYDIKKYEYRKRFCKEATTAFLYLSAPVQEVIGIMELGVPILIKNVIPKYPEGSAIRTRSQRCIDAGEQFAIPIESLQLYKKPISIEEIKKVFPDFHVPQCYLEITKYKSVYELLCNREMYDVEFSNNHQSLFEDNFGTTCREMEMTSEFEHKNIIYIQNPKYNIVKCGYLNDKYRSI